jgi:hypothetical protein
MASPKLSPSTIFVLQHNDLPVPEIIAKGKEAGLELTKKVIYRVRGRTRKRAERDAAKSKRASKAKAGRSNPKGKLIRRYAHLSVSEILAISEKKGMPLSRSYVNLVLRDIKEQAGGLPAKPDAQQKPITTVKSVEPVVVSDSRQARIRDAERGLENAVIQLGLAYANAHLTKIDIQIGRT